MRKRTQLAAGQVKTAIDQLKLATANLSYVKYDQCYRLAMAVTDLQEIHVNLTDPDCTPEAGEVKGMGKWAKVAYQNEREKKVASDIFDLLSRSGLTEPESIQLLDTLKGDMLNFRRAQEILRRAADDRAKLEKFGTDCPNCNVPAFYEDAVYCGRCGAPSPDLKSQNYASKH